MIFYLGYDNEIEWEYEPTKEQLKEAQYKYLMLEYGLNESTAKKIVKDFDLPIEDFPEGTLEEYLYGYAEQDYIAGEELRIENQEIDRRHYEVWRF